MRTPRQHCTDGRHGFFCNMTRHDDCYDKFVRLLNAENELGHGEAFATRDAAKMSIVSYMECFYIRKPLHQTLGDRTPAVVDGEAMSARLTCAKEQATSVGFIVL